ncbi:MAG TPA: hypothetical protein VJY33_22425 [Isosphaeraceae bacterium]|nr:hypothetical protein [Isosphaeraceae bacterium]
MSESVEKKRTLLSILFEFVLCPFVIGLAASLLANRIDRGMSPWLSPALRIISTPVPAWSLLFVSLVTVGVINSLHARRLAPDRDNLQAYREAIRFREELNKRDKELWHEQLRKLEREVKESRSQLTLTQADVVALREKFERLSLYCKFSGQWLGRVLNHIYPLILETSDRMREAFVASSKGKRADLLKEFDTAFDAGRNIGPEPVRGRERIIFYTGVLGQLVLDIAYEAEIAVELPGGMLSEAQQHPRWEIDQLFDFWLGKAQAALSQRLPVLWARTPPWAGVVLDGLIAEASRESTPGTKA